MLKKMKLISLFIVFLFTNLTLMGENFKKTSEDVNVEKVLGKMKRVSYLDKQLKMDTKAYVKGQSQPFTGVFYLMVGNYLEYTESYDKGILSGDKIWYDPNGNIMMIETYVNGRLHGEQVTYYPNTKPRSIVSYSRGRIQKGEWYSKNGDVLFKETYTDGTGKWKHFYDDGSIHEIGEYLNGSRHGTWKTYNVRGELERTVNYQNGRMVSRSWL